MASEARARRGHRGAIRGRHRGGLSQQSGCRIVPGGTYGTNAKVQPGTASRENAPAGIWSVCDRPTAVAWRRETGNVQLSWLYAHLREEEEQWTVHGVAANDPQKIADEAERGESRTSAADARTHPRTGQWLQAVVRGHIQYYGVPLNQNALWIFRFQVGGLWHRALSRRSQNGRVLWDRMRRLITRWLPPPTVCHPYPLRRMGVIA